MNTELIARALEHADGAGNRVKRDTTEDMLCQAVREMWDNAIVPLMASQARLQAALNGTAPVELTPDDAPTERVWKKVPGLPANRKSYGNPE